jgi:AcrR family transcriptional regulator
MGAPQRGRIDKRQAVITAARAVFGREGYARATIDMIAAEAAVSTRTVYNHFDGKAALFKEVIEDSSTLVADRITAVIRTELDRPDDLEAALERLARTWIGLRDEFPDHEALAQQLSVEARHLPADLLQAWHEAGAGRAERELARHLELLAHRGLLEVPDPALAAVHFLLITLGSVAHLSEGGAVALSGSEIDRAVTGGVRTFLGGYAQHHGH